jgi:hypothetical protein
MAWYRDSFTFLLPSWVYCGGSWMMSIMTGDHCQEIGTNRRIILVKCECMGSFWVLLIACFKEDASCSYEYSNLPEHSLFKSCWHLQLRSKYIVTCISVAREQLGKHVPAKKNSWPTIGKGLSIARQRTCEQPPAGCFTTISDFYC